MLNLDEAMIMVSRDIRLRYSKHAASYAFAHERSYNFVNIISDNVTAGVALDFNRSPEANINQVKDFMDKVAEIIEGGNPSVIAVVDHIAQGQRPDYTDHTIDIHMITIDKDLYDEICV